MTVEEVPQDNTPLDFDPDGNPIPDADRRALEEPNLSGGGGGTSSPTPTISDPINDPVTPAEPIAPIDIPTGEYLRTRYTGIEFSTGPVSSDDGAWPAFAITPSVRLRTNEVHGPGPGISYRWQGYFTFEAGIYAFSWRGNGGYEVTVGATDILFKDLTVPASPQQSVVINKELPAGRQLVTVEWQYWTRLGDTTDGQVAFSFNKIAEESWISCEDGLRHEGPPPADWTLTTSNCWAAPEDPEDPIPQTLEVIKISPDPALGIDRAHILGTTIPPDQQQYSFQNLSTNMMVALALKGPEMLRFFNSDTGAELIGFSLVPQQLRLIDVRFKSNVLDTLDEGLHGSQIYVTMDVTQIVLEDPDQPPIPPTDEPPPPPPPPPVDPPPNRVTGVRVTLEGNEIVTIWDLQSDAVSYQIRTENNGTGVQLETLTAFTPPHRRTLVTPGTYTTCVVPVGPTGLTGFGMCSSVTYDTTQAPPNPVTGFNVVLEGNEIVTTWDASLDASQYEITAGINSTNITFDPAIITATSHRRTITDLGSYWNCVRAVGPGGLRSDSRCSSVTYSIPDSPTDPPTALTGLILSIAGDQLTVSWDMQSDAIGYTIDGGIASAGGESEFDSITVVSSPHLKTLTTPAEYWICVRPLGANGKFGTPLCEYIVFSPDTPPPPDPGTSIYQLHLTTARNTGLGVATNINNQTPIYIELLRRDGSWRSSLGNDVAAPGVTSVVFDIDGAVNSERLFRYEAPEGAFIPVTFTAGTHRISYEVFGTTPEVGELVFDVSFVIHPPPPPPPDDGTSTLITRNTFDSGTGTEDGWTVR